MDAELTHLPVSTGRFTAARTIPNEAAEWSPVPLAASAHPSE